MDVRAYLIKALFAHVPRAHASALIDGDDDDGGVGGYNAAHSARVAALKSTAHGRPVGQCGRLGCVALGWPQQLRDRAYVRVCACVVCACDNARSQSIRSNHTHTNIRRDEPHMRRIAGITASPHRRDVRAQWTVSLVVPQQNARHGTNAHSDH